MTPLFDRSRVSVLGAVALCVLALTALVTLQETARILLAGLVLLAPLLHVAPAVRRLQGWQRGGGLAELLATPTSAWDVVDALAAEGARRGAAVVVWLAWPLVGALLAIVAVSPETALYLAVSAALVLPLAGAQGLLSGAESLQGLPKPRTFSRVALGMSWCAGLAATQLAMLLGCPELLYLLGLLPLTVLGTRAELAARLHAWSVGGALTPAAPANTWELRLNAPRADVLRSLASGGRALGGRPRLALTPALLCLVPVVAVWTLGAWFPDDKQFASVLTLAVAAAAVAAMGVLLVLQEVRREWEGSTIALLWTSSLSAERVTDGWAGLWALPATVGTLLALPVLFAFGVDGGLSAAGALLLAALPASLAPLAGYAGVWAASAGERPSWLRGLVALLGVVAVPAIAVLGQLIRSELVELPLLLALALLLAHGARYQAVCELKHGVHGPGFSSR